MCRASPLVCTFGNLVSNRGVMPSTPGVQRKRRRKRSRFYSRALPRQQLAKRMISLFLFLSLFVAQQSIGFLVTVEAKHPHNKKPATKTSFYDLLGVSRTCSANDLKKAFRKQALKHHPDKGGDEKKFKELSKAYEVLSDPEQRAAYDRFGEAGVPGNGVGGTPGGPAPGTHHFQFFPGSTSTGYAASGGSTGGRAYLNPEDILRRFGQTTGGGIGTGGGFGMRAAPFGNVFGGTENGVDVESILREMMGGSTSTPGPTADPTPMERPLPCSLEELALGRLKKVRLKLADGRSRLFAVQLQQGWKAGTKLKYPATRTFPAVTLVVQEKPHPTFTRQGHDLLYQVPQGTMLIKLSLLDGEVCEWRLPHVMRRGEQISIAGKGMPIKGGPGRGNLILQFT